MYCAESEQTAETINEGASNIHNRIGRVETIGLKDASVSNMNIKKVKSISNKELVTDDGNLSVTRKGGGIVESISADGSNALGDDVEMIDIEMTPLSKKIKHVRVSKKNSTSTVTIERKTKTTVGSRTSTETIDLISSSDDEETQNNSFYSDEQNHYKKCSILRTKVARKLPTNYYQQRGPTTDSSERQPQHPSRSSNQIPFAVFQRNNGKINGVDALCSICNNSLSAEQFHLCDNCGLATHNRCVTNCGENRKWRYFMADYPPMKNGIRATSLPPPDYRFPPQNEGITWTTKTINVVRQRSTGGKLPSLGVEIRHTEEMQDFLMQLLGNNILLSNLTQESLPTLCPLAVDVRGAAVVGLFENYVAGLSGLQVSDFITAVEFIGHHNDTDNDRKSNDNGNDQLHPSFMAHSSAWHDLALITPTERTVLLRRDVSHFRFTIQRPSQNLILSGKEWLQYTYTINSIVNKRCAYQQQMEKPAPRWLWFCPDCSNPRVGKNQGEIEDLEEFEI